MPKVSVIIPCYNAQRFLRECLDSVLGQTLHDIEVICIDDASTDGTAQMLSEYAGKDSRIRVITHTENKFAGEARNQGIQKAKGKYLSFLDSDDFFEPDMLERMYNQCTRDNADICICGGRIYDMVSQQLIPASHYLNLKHLPKKVPFMAGDRPDSAMFFSCPAPWNKMFSKKFVLDKKLRFQPLQRSNDVYFVLLAIAVAECITVTDRFLVNYRRGTATSLQETGSADLFCFFEALKALRQGMREHGVFELYEKSYIRFCLGVCIYTLNFQKTKENWLSVALRLKEEILPELGCAGMPENYFPGSDNYGEMQFLLQNSADELAMYEPELRRDESLTEKPASANWIETDDSLNSLKVSVIIPVYNMEEYLEECLRSVMGQTLRGIEIICIDDGSVDSSPLILERMCKEDSRIRVFRQKNAGLSAARNTGMSKAQGEYITFLDSDDLLVWCALEHSYREAKTKDLDQLFYAADCFYEPVELYSEYAKSRTYYHYKNKYPPASEGKELFVRLVEGMDFKTSACTQLIRRGFLEDNNINFYSGILHEDNLFTLHCLALSRRVSVLGAPLYLRRIRPGSIMTVGKSWAHAYGYLISVYQFKKLLGKLNIDNMDYLTVAAQHMIRLIYAAGSSLENLSSEDVRKSLCSLLPDERIEFTLYLEYNNRFKSFKNNEKRQKLKLKRITKKLYSARQSLKELKKESGLPQKGAAKKQRSFFYRLVRFLAFPLRLIRRLIKGKS
ncbi:MAG: glycosyltransferase [Oscillospiraceae bacterium]|nr:glycosyltransferase [Oscillospiraceae bacterium]